MPDNPRQFNGAMEDLDPPPERAPRAPRWEIVIGAILVLGLAGFGLWQWWDQQTRLTSYQAGERAAAGQDWPAAQADYRAASGYADADQRAAAAQRMIGYEAALSGTIAMRPQASPPGLYAITTGGWKWLPGSDRQSRVLGTCPDGDLLYDRAWAGNGLPPTPEPGRVPPRQIVVGARSGEVRTVVSLDPARFQWYVCTKAGVWGAWPTDEQASQGDSHFAAPRLDVAYQAFGAARPTAPVLPGPAWFISGIAPDGRHLLLVDPSAAGGIWRPALYLAEADGSAPRLLTTLPGAPGPTVLGAAGPDLVFTTYEPLPDGRTYTNTVLLIDPSGARPPRALAQTQVHAEVFDEHFRITAQVLTQGPRAGQVLLTWPEGDHAVVRLVDPAQPAAPLDYRTEPGIDQARVLSTEASDGGILLGAGNAARPPSVGDSMFLYPDAQSRWQEINVPLSEASGVLGAWVRDDRLVFADLAYPFTRSATLVVAVHSLPLRPNPQPQAMQTIYISTISGADAPGPPWYPGPGLLAYTTPEGDLHARAYDGSEDVLLDSGLHAYFAALTNP